MPFGVAHTIILRVAKWAVGSFFDTVEVIHGENVPKTGPVIIACTHHNMSVDPMVLSASFPHARKLHYWAKSDLFGNPVVGKILLNAGNVPVYRKASNNQALYKGTFDVLAVGEVVAIFPEGTSYTEPHVMQVKDGVSWTALEYYKWLETPEGQKCTERDLVIVPCSIVYTDKSHYRSSAIVEYGKPISLRDYAKQFLSGAEGAEKASVKMLTKEIGTRLVEMTINAPDWETLLSAKMARHLLWGDDGRIPLQEWVEVNQTLTDLFCGPSPSPSITKAKEDLLNYYTLLKSARLTNASLSQLPLPQTLDPTRPVPLPSRLRTVWVLFVDTLASMLRLPFFLLPLLVHIPAYLAGRMGARLVENEEETMAQNKIVFGLLSLALIYPSLFFFLWALLYLSPPGFLVAALTLSGFTVYHTRLIDDNYTHAKRLIAAWRVLIGVWGPRHWDLPVASLKTQTKFIPPPPNPWLDVNKPPKDATPAPSLSDSAPAPKASSKAAKADKSKSKTTRNKIASRHLVRHVLRARISASQSLSRFLAEIQRSDGDVRASAYLAARYPSSIAFHDGNGEQASTGASGEIEHTGPATYQFLPVNGPTKKRYAKEVVKYLKDHGAQIGDLDHVGEGDWAAELLSSGDEGTNDEDEADDEVRFVPPGAN